MNRPLRLAGLVLLGFIISCSHLQQARDSHLGKETGAQSQTQNESSPAKGERGTPAEAKAMLKQAVAHYNSVGRKQALADFTAKKAPFGDRDL